MNGSTWTAVDNISKNETELFSDQDLYLQGFGAASPDIYVLDTPVYNPDQTVSYTAVTKYHQAWVVLSSMFSSGRPGAPSVREWNTLSP